MLALMSAPSEDAFSTTLQALLDTALAKGFPRTVAAEFRCLLKTPLRERACVMSAVARALSRAALLPDTRKSA